MNNSNSQFTGSIPEIYDTYLGPLLFEFSAKDLADRIKHLIPLESKVLEVACGTGILTHHLRKTFPETSKIIATDLNEAMLEVAAFLLINPKDDDSRSNAMTWLDRAREAGIKEIDDLINVIIEND